MNEAQQQQAPPLHQVRTPEGFEGWQWLNGPVFLYNKNDPSDVLLAQEAALEWAGLTMQIEKLQLESTRRHEVAKSTQPTIINFEDARRELEQPPGDGNV